MHLRYQLRALQIPQTHGQLFAAGFNLLQSSLEFAGQGLGRRLLAQVIKAGRHVQCMGPRVRQRLQLPVQFALLCVQGCHAATAIGPVLNVEADILDALQWLQMSAGTAEKTSIQRQAFGLAAHDRRIHCPGSPIVLAFHFTAAQHRRQ